MKQLLAQFSQWDAFREIDYDWMVANGSILTLGTGDVLMLAGQAVDAMHILLDGGLTVSVSQGGQTPREIARLSPGEIVGEMSLVDSRTAAVTVVAEKNSRLLSLPQSKLTAKLAGDRDFATNLYQMLAVTISRRLRVISDLLAQFQMKSGEPLRKVWLVFAVLNDSDIEWMVANGKGGKADPGTVLITQGKSVEYLYILLSGTLDIFIQSQVDGATVERPIAQSLKGEIIGEMSFVETAMASATVKAASSSLLLALPQKLLGAKLQQDNDFAARFYQAIAIVLVDRLRDRLMQRSLGIADIQEQFLAEDVEFSDEMDMDILDNMAIAGTRFDWMIAQIG